MASTLVEQTRLLHQDIEVHRTHVVDDLLEETKTNKERILQEHRMKMRLDQIQSSGERLLELYDDVDKARENELTDMSGENVFSTFYDRLKQIREYHRKFPDQQEDEDYEMKPKVKFQGAEVFGMFLDLHPLFERYINLPMFTKTDYRSYLGLFDKTAQVGKEKKMKHYKAYKTYVADLIAYLMEFQQKTKPLVQVTELVAIIDEEFDSRWKAKTVPGWQVQEGVKDANGAPVPVGDAAAAPPSAADEANTLYCKPCNKTFTKLVSFTAHLGGRKHKKNLMLKDGFAKKEDPREKDLAKNEYRVLALADLNRDVIIATQDHIEKKQTRTYDEIAADLEEQADEEVLSSSEDEEDEKPIYNPLNLPLGWDGKPIPYWLYKFHGLNIEHKCEICGGFSYWGPRAFERHFTEWRHTYGLRCLGITNSKEYAHITKFDDAVALSEKLSKKATAGWQPDEEEEFEDDEGNVFNKKTYDDLKRQGII